MTKCIIPIDTEIGQKLRGAAVHCRILLIVGLPSTGKSLMLQQLIILASEAGRQVHTMQWDDARSAFETQDWLEVFPEVDNVTHPRIRKAVGLWVRGAVQNWCSVYSTSKDLLIVELPVIGGRFVELLQPHDDAPEAVMKSNDTLALVPVPTNEIRRVIAGFRAAPGRNRQKFRCFSMQAARRARCAASTRWREPLESGRISPAGAMASLHPWLVTS